MMLNPCQWHRLPIPTRTTLVAFLLTSGFAPFCRADEPRPDVPAQVVGSNLVVNGGFEAGREGWSSMQVVGAGTFEGEKAGLLDNSAGAPSKAIVQNFIPIKPRTYYRFSMAARRKTGQGYLYARCDYMEAPGKRLMSSQNWSAGRAMPVTLRTGEGTGTWQRYSGEFAAQRGDTAGVRLVIYIMGGADEVLLDDVRLEEIRYPEAPPWNLAEAGLWPGSPSRFGMAVEEAVIEAGSLRVTTTGAEFYMNATPGASLYCSQRIGKRRSLAEVRFEPPLRTNGAPLRIARHDADACVVVAGDVALTFHGDSLLTIAANRPLRYRVVSHIATEHFASTDQHLLAIDEHGGFCAVTHARPRLHSAGSRIVESPESTEELLWSAGYEIAAKEMGAIAVFPPRPFDWKRSFGKRIVNTYSYPDSDALREYSKHANVLFLFGGIYADQPEGNTHAPYRVADPAKLRATIALAHELGMQVICYRHPTSYVWAEIPMEEAIADMRAFRRKYGFDGWYFDGLYYAGIWSETYEFIRRMRDEVGPEGIIYTHCTLNPPSRMCQLYLPFVDAYSDFLLRGEGQTIYGPKDPYLRYVVGTYNISNAIATLKGDKMLREGAKEPEPPEGKRPTRAELQAMWRPVACPLREQLDVMLRLNGRCRWAYPGWPLRESDREDYLGFYFKRLDEMQAQWEKTGEPIPMRWGN